MPNAYEILVCDSPKPDESLRGTSEGDSPKSGYVIPPEEGNVIPPKEGDANTEKSRQPIEEETLEGKSECLKEQSKEQLKEGVNFSEAIWKVEHRRILRGEVATPIRLEN